MPEPQTIAAGGIARAEVTVQDLRARLRGPPLRPGDDGYAAACGPSPGHRARQDVTLAQSAAARRHGGDDSRRLSTPTG